MISRPRNFHLSTGRSVLERDPNDVNLEDARQHEAVADGKGTELDCGHSFEAMQISDLQT